jgi:hypothetical protein
MTNNKLPTYFKEYLDERFKNIDNRFNEMSGEIAILRDEIGNIKLSSVIVGAVGGLLTAVGGFFGLQIFKK